MRIIAGKYKGRNFSIPNNRDVRPTTDRVKESMFSSLVSLIGTFNGISVLDCFAGSGSLGFESVSRGASKLVAFENNKKTFEHLNRNYQIFKDDDNDCKLFFADVLKSNLAFLLKDYCFDLVFFDPPYAYSFELVLKILNDLKSNNVLSNNAIIVYEHSSSSDIKDFDEDFSKLGFCKKQSKIYGDIALEFYCFKRGINE